MANYQTILVQSNPTGVRIVFNRVAQQNSINRILLEELNAVLDETEKNPKCRLIVLEGQNGFFSTGMDFQEFSERDPREELPAPQAYMNIIKRFTLTPKIIVSKVEGQVTAGGIGLVAASDFVVATPASRFSLSEALWGLLPAMVIPYLIRRVGFQSAYQMTLTTLPLSGEQAREIHLVDELHSSPEESIKRLWLRVGKIEQATIQNMKQYFRRMWIVTEEMENAALAEITKLMNDPSVRENIRHFVQFQQFPWERQK
jgi:polyketide biosynthesis enoyl-CoA hydratase PksH